MTIAAEIAVAEYELARMGYCDLSGHRHHGRPCGARRLMEALGVSEEDLTPADQEEVQWLDRTHGDTDAMDQLIGLILRT